MVQNDINVNEVSLNLNFQGSTLDGVRSWFNGVVTSLRAGDDEAMTLVFMTLSFAIAGIFVFRRL